MARRPGGRGPRPRGSGSSRGHRRPGAAAPGRCRRGGPRCGEALERRCGAGQERLLLSRIMRSMPKTNPEEKVARMMGSHMAALLVQPLLVRSEGLGARWLHEGYQMGPVRKPDTGPGCGATAAGARGLPPASLDWVNSGRRRSVRARGSNSRSGAAPCTPPSGGAPAPGGAGTASFPLTVLACKVSNTPHSPAPAAGCPEARSSGGERLLDTQEVGGSRPPVPTNCPFVTA